MKILAWFKSWLPVIALALQSAATWGATTNELLKQGDIHDLKFNPTQALKHYLPAEQVEPDNVTILLRIARQYRHQMADVEAADEKIRFSELALRYAQRAVCLAPKDSEAQLSNAICYAKSLELYDNKEKMDALRQIKIFADKAVALDAHNDLAWYILGRWYQRVCDLGTLKRKVAEIAYGDLPNATYEDAIKCFRKAIDLNSKRSVYYVDLGITCASLEQTEEAKQYIARGLALPSTGKDDPEAKKRGQEALQALQ